MTEDTEKNIGTMLAVVTEQLVGIRRDMEVVRENQVGTEQRASVGRQAIHERIDQMERDVNQRLYNLNTTVIGSTAANNQTLITVEELREDVTRLKEVMQTEVMPVVKTVNALEGQGYKALISAATAGAAIAVAIGGVVVTNWDRLTAWVKITF